MVTAPDGRVLGLYTSGVDAWLRAKPVAGARVCRVRPNADGAEVVASAVGRESPARSKPEHKQSGNVDLDFTILLKATPKKMCGGGGDE